MECFKIWQHEKGMPKYMDKCISPDLCYTKEQAIEIVDELNESKFRNKYKYYIKMII